MINVLAIPAAHLLGDEDSDDEGGAGGGAGGSGSSSVVELEFNLKTYLQR